MISNKDLSFFVQNNYNVIFRGKHGVGKTSIILDTFKQHGLKYKMFSASTMDPWVDFVGIPKEKVTEDGIPYLDLIRPLEFQKDEIEAIFMDEYNRANHKVRNACMELIQFKSINGKKFNNLKMVWVAINPKEDGDNVYDVEDLDPAQADRFHAIIDLPYVPDKKYFTNKYPELGSLAIEWWNSLNKEHKDKVSPRRLDYLLDVHLKGGDVSYFVEDCINIKAFNTKMHQHSIKKVFNKAIKDKLKEDIAKIISSPMYFDTLEKDILKHIEIFIDYIPEEKIIKYLNNNESTIISYIKLNMLKHIDLITIYINNTKNNKKTINELTPIFKQVYSTLTKNNLPITPIMTQIVTNNLNKQADLLQKNIDIVNNFQNSVGVVSAAERRDIFYSYVKVHHEIPLDPDKHRLLESIMVKIINPSNVSTFELRHHFSKLIASNETDLDDVKKYIANCSEILRYIKSNFIKIGNSILDIKLKRLIDHYDNALDVVITNEIGNKLNVYKYLEKLSVKFKITSIQTAKYSATIDSTIDENSEEDEDDDSHIQDEDEIKPKQKYTI